jgi:hypothetical protein
MKQIVFWDAAITTEDSNEILSDLALAHLREIAISAEEDPDDYVESVCRIIERCSQ